MLLHTLRGIRNRELDMNHTRRDFASRLGLLSVGTMGGKVFASIARVLPGAAVQEPDHAHQLHCAAGSRLPKSRNRQGHLQCDERPSETARALRTHCMLGHSVVHYPAAVNDPQFPEGR